MTRPTSRFCDCHGASAKPSRIPTVPFHANYVLGAPEVFAFNFRTAPVMAASDEDALPRKKTKLEALEETKDREMAAGSRVALVLCGSFSPITYLHLRLFGGL